MKFIKYNRKINQTVKGTLVRKLEVLYNRGRKGDEDYEKPYKHI